MKHNFYSFTGFTFLAASYTNKAASVPSTIPPRTSVGKWTKKYSLLNAISAARMIAAAPAFLL